MELEATFQSKRPRLSGAVDAMSVDAVPDVSGGGLGVVDVSGAGVATSVATSVDAGVPMDVSGPEFVDALMVIEKP